MMLKAGVEVHSWAGAEQDGNGTEGNWSPRGRGGLENAGSSRISKNCGIS